MRFTMKMTALAALVASLGTGAAVLADETAGPRGDKKAAIMAKFDSNGDGKLDENERAAMREAFKAKHEERRAEMLARFDANKDGKLDEAERKTMRDTLSAERFAKLDTNHDGQLSLAEFQAGAGRGHHRGFGK